MLTLALVLVVHKDKTGVLGPGLEIDVPKQVAHCGVWFPKSQRPLHGAFPVSQAFPNPRMANKIVRICK